MLNKIISDLKNFARTNFPTSDVSSYLKNVKLSDNDLEKYLLKKDKQYTRNLIHKDVDFEIMVVCWPPKISAPIHGHEGEKCWARVEDGELQISNYKKVSSNPLELIKTKQMSCLPGYLDGPAEIHSVENLTSQFATSLHVYARPYDACDVYDLGKGTVNRLKLGYHSIDGVLCS